MPAHKIKANFKFKKRGKLFSTIGGSGHILEIQSEKVSLKLKKKIQLIEDFVLNLLLQLLWIYGLQKKLKNKKERKNKSIPAKVFR